MSSFDNRVLPPGGQDTTQGNSNGVIYIKGDALTPGSFRWQIGTDNSGNTSAILQQLLNGSWQNVQNSNMQGSNVANSVMTGPGTFGLSNMHYISSGGENVYFQNQRSGVNYFPAWQSCTWNGTSLSETLPTYRQHSAVNSQQPNGALQSGSVQVGSTNSFGVNTSIYQVSVVPAESYVGVLTYSAWNNNTNGILLFAQSISVNITAGTQYNFNLSPALDLAAGYTIYGQITKADGTLLKVQPGTPNNLPWIQIQVAGYNDFPLGNPTGTIINWAGDQFGLSVPAGYWPCDGSKISAPGSPLDGKYAPDTRASTIIGANSTYQKGTTYGSNQIALSLAQLPNASVAMSGVFTPSGSINTISAFNNSSSVTSPAGFLGSTSSWSNTGIVAQASSTYVPYTSGTFNRYDGLHNHTFTGTQGNVNVSGSINGGQGQQYTSVMQQSLAVTQLIKL
jgi:hypothetical protein